MLIIRKPFFISITLKKIKQTRIINFTKNIIKYKCKIKKIIIGRYNIYKRGVGKCYLCSTKGERIIHVKQGKTYIIKGKVSTSPKIIIRKCYLYHFVVKKHTFTQKVITSCTQIQFFYFKN